MTVGVQFKPDHPAVAPVFIAFAQSYGLELGTVHAMMRAGEVQVRVDEQGSLFVYFTAELPDEQMASALDVLRRSQKNEAHTDTAIRNWMNARMR